MSRDTIPDDIIAEAKSVAETVCRNLDYDDVEIEVLTIAMSLYRERMRSVGIASRHLNVDEGSYFLGRSHAAEEIIKEIEAK